METHSIFGPQRGPRIMGTFNGRGLWTLYLKEVRRFLSVATQTLLAPMVTTLLFLAIFALALGGAGREINGMPYIEFLAPGLIMMTLMQNSFANTSSSIVMAKVQGNIVDVLMPPLSAGELTFGFAAGGVTRGLMVGCAAGVAMAFFVPLPLANPFSLIFHAVNGALMLSLLGVIGGIWAEKYDQMAAVTNFIITPFSFLSGTFYSIERLPADWQFIAHFNPFFYLIDGFRHGVIGMSDGSPLVGFAVVLGINIALWTLAHRMFATGYRLKA